MTFPADLAKQFPEDKIAFVKRTTLKAEVLEPGFVLLRVPLLGNENHLGSMNAGALFTLAETPGGAPFLTSFDVKCFYPIVKEMHLRFRRPATDDICVEARLSTTEIQRLQNQAEANGKAEYRLELELTDPSGEVVALSRGLYQLRKY